MPALSHNTGLTRLTCPKSLITQKDDKMKKTLVLIAILLTVGCSKENDPEVYTPSYEEGTYELVTMDIGFGALPVREDISGNITITLLQGRATYRDLDTQMVASYTLTKDLYDKIVIEFPQPMLMSGIVNGKELRLETREIKYVFKKK